MIPPYCPPGISRSLAAGSALIHIRFRLNEYGAAKPRSAPAGIISEFLAEVFIFPRENKANAILLVSECSGLTSINPNLAG
jgi:hypothetical protein